MASFLYFLPLVVGVIVLIRLASQARLCRKDADLGDMFMDAIKNKKYRDTISRMIVIVLLTAGYMFVILK